MATKTQLFSYDDVEHQEIQAFLKSVKNREKSKYIRLALKEYIDRHGFSSSDTQYNASNKQTQKKQPTKNRNNNDFSVDADPKIFELGK